MQLWQEVVFHPPMMMMMRGSIADSPVQDHCFPQQQQQHTFPILDLDIVPEERRSRNNDDDDDVSSNFYTQRPLEQWEVVEFGEHLEEITQKLERQLLLHKHIDELFQKYKNKIEPSLEDPLLDTQPCTSVSGPGEMSTLVINNEDGQVRGWVKYQRGDRFRVNFKHAQERGEFYFQLPDTNTQAHVKDMGNYICWSMAGFISMYASAIAMGFHDIWESHSAVRLWLGFRDTCLFTLVCYWLITTSEAANASAFVVGVWLSFLTFGAIAAGGFLRKLQYDFETRTVRNGPFLFLVQKIFGFSDEDMLLLQKARSMHFNPQDYPPPFVEDTCVVCLTEPSTLVFLPCNHQITCHFCSKKVSKCPKCRSKICWGVNPPCPPTTDM